jgi:glutamine amidotransferase-like uncharacterized protein
MPKIFIYNGKNTGESSRSDLYTFFTTTRVFDHPDVCFSDFKSSFDGLLVADNPTLVVPGGNAGYMLGDLKNELAKIKNLVQYHGFHYVGVCAGAYIATINTDILSTDYKINSTNYSLSLNEVNKLIGLCGSYKAIGPFFPHPIYTGYNEAELKRTPRPYLPMSTLIRYNQQPYVITSQLFVSGCAFVPDDGCDKGYESVAYYLDSSSYTFNYPYRTERYSSLSSAIRKKASNNNKHCGGVFLTGTHIEASVPNSCMSRFFSTKQTNTHFPLSELCEKNLGEDAVHVQNAVVPLLQDTFKR